MDSNGPFTDIDDLEAIEGKCLLFDNGLELNGDDTYTTEYYGNTSDNPWTLLGWTKSDPSIDRSAGCQTGPAHLLMKWGFAY